MFVFHVSHTLVLATQPTNLFQLLAPFNMIRVHGHFVLASTICQPSPHRPPSPKSLLPHKSAYTSKPHNHARHTQHILTHRLACAARQRIHAINTKRVLTHCGWRRRVLLLPIAIACCYCLLLLPIAYCYCLLLLLGNKQ